MSLSYLSEELLFLGRNNIIYKLQYSSIFSQLTKDTNFASSPYLVMHCVSGCFKISQIIAGVGKGLIITDPPC
jgi:hypothetical protein